MAHIYILQSQKNNKFYIGSTKNLKQRLIFHTEGKSRYTKGILPIVLVFNQEFKTILQAQKAEKWLKKQKDKNLIKRIIFDGIIKKDFI